ncbi:hypothetical protein [Paenisporosarcina sp. TG-14]|uniref:hypothetical protein n=1 Tax=Paenisporosarcina sp. TG-14 TaxID=1231057 RepID=UPI0002E7DF33|nr:hypothetical protein [Paenisporosarcina sp. TG-14]
MRSIMKLVGSIVGLFVAFNLVFVGFQYFSEKAEHDRMRLLKGMMDSYGAQLRTGEAGLKEREANIHTYFKDLEFRKHEMNGLVQQYPNGMPTTVYANYQQSYQSYQLDSRNYQVLIADLEAYRKNYENLIVLHNDSVAEYNELNEQVGDTWFIVPGFRGK